AGCRDEPLRDKRDLGVDPGQHPGGRLAAHVRHPSHRLSVTPPALRVFAWGVGVATLYLVVAAAEFRPAAIPIRILFDGVAPLPPYRWVRPPEELAKGNQPPEAGMGTVPLEA